MYPSSLNEIAIIGISLRVPGANNYRQFWQNICQGTRSIRHIPKEELAKWGVPKEKLEDPNYINAYACADDLDCFDADFFGISPRLAKTLDPQHRIFLECTYEILEDAGYLGRRKEKNIGIFGGVQESTSTYQAHYLGKHPEIAGKVATYYAIAMNNDYATTRTSFLLDLHGPSLNIQTAASTSLVAVHLACQALIDNSCRMAVAGGVSIKHPSYAGHIFEAGSIYSKDGYCRTFDAEASGTLFSDGIGVVLLKKLSEAIKDGDHIYAVIHSSLLNNDGRRKADFTSPSPEGQIEGLTQLFSKAGIEPGHITYIETHGTGTAVGDPIEFNSLKYVFGKSSLKSKCAMGSLKPCVGHLGPAAGVASLIKAALCIYHGKIPPMVGINKLNPAIDLDHSPFYFNKEVIDWKPSTQSRMALINAFGIGGTNAFVLLKEAPKLKSEKSSLEYSPNRQVKEASTSLAAKYLPFFLSAKTTAALERQIEQYKKFFSQNEDANLLNVSYTLGVAREHFSQRIALAASSGKEISSLLGSQGYFKGIRDLGKPQIAFVFSGQGSQYQGMASELYLHHPYFKEQMELCSSLLKPYLDIDLLSLIFEADDELISQTKYTQPALFAVEFSLFKLLESWGITPHYVLGHSVGEFVAAAAAGVISLEEGLRLITKRGALIQSLPEVGAMVAIIDDVADVVKKLNDFQQKYPDKIIDLAAFNGHEQLVVSGMKEHVLEFAKKWKNTKQLNVSHAFHSRLLQPITRDFHSFAQSLSYAKPCIPIVSNLDGQIVQSSSIGADYWLKHLLSPVHFSQSIETLLAEKVNIFIEISPQPALSKSIQELAGTSRNVLTVSTLRKGQNDLKQLFDALSKLYVNHVEIDFEGLFRFFEGRPASLPTYPFEKTLYSIVQQPSHQLESSESASKANPQQKAHSSISDQLLQLSAEEKLPFLQKMIKQNIGHVLGLENTEALDVNQSFVYLGLDSLARTDLINRLQQQLDARLNYSMINAQSTIDDLAQILLPNTNMYSNQMEEHLDAPAYAYLPLQEQVWKPLSSQILLFQHIQSFLSNCGMDVQISFPLNVDLLQQAINAFLEVNPIFYLKLNRKSSTYKIGTYTPIQLILIDLRKNQRQHEVRKESYQRLIKNEFSCNGSPLFQTALFHLSENQYSLQFSFPHLISDYFCIKIAIDHIFKNYFLLEKGLPTIPYNPQRDYLIRSCEKEAEIKALWENEKEHWKKAANNYKHVLADWKVAKSFYSNPVQHIGIPKDLMQSFNQICTQHNCDKMIALMTLTSLSLCLLTNQKECSLEFVLHGRNNSDDHHTFGPLTTNVPLDLKYQLEMTLIELMKRQESEYHAQFHFSLLGSPLCSLVKPTRLPKKLRLLHFIHKLKLKLSMPTFLQELNLDYYLRMFSEATLDRIRKPKRRKMRLLFNSYTDFTSENCSTKGLTFNAFEERLIATKTFFHGKRTIPLIVVFFFKLPDGNFNLMIPVSPLKEFFESKILQLTKAAIETFVNDPQASICSLSRKFSVF